MAGPSSATETHKNLYACALHAGAWSLLPAHHRLAQLIG
jgi:hypothetical protein